MLDRLSSHVYCYFLDGLSKYFHIPIAMEDKAKTTFTCPYNRFAYRRMMDDFSVFGDSFDLCRWILERVINSCEENNLVLNWKKHHFIVQQIIVLDRATIKNIEKLPPSSSLKAISSFLGHTGFYHIGEGIFI